MTGKQAPEPANRRIALVTVQEAPDLASWAAGLVTSMGNLRTNPTAPDEIAAHFKAQIRMQFNAPPGEVYPGGPGLVIREDCGVRIVARLWGLRDADLLRRPAGSGERAVPAPRAGQ